MNKQFFMKKETKGITLIALVVTIVVLLILAGVSLNLVLGENGIINKAKETKIKNSHAVVTDAINLAYADYKMEIEMSSNTNENEIVKVASTEVVEIPAIRENSLSTTSTGFKEYLLSKNYIDENNVINVANLVGSKQALGNGTGDTDVYKLEQESEKYILRYYGEDAEITILWEVSESKQQETINWTEILEDAKNNPENWKPEGQESSSIGIGANGKPVNMDDWGTDKVNGKYIIRGPYGCVRYSPAYYGMEKDVVVPQYIKKEGDSDFIEVVGIGERAFNGNRYIESVQIPSSVIAIGEEAFEDCTALKNIKISKGLTNIGNSAFSGCTSLESIPEDLFENCTQVEYFVKTFEGCTSLTSIPENLFKNCTQVEYFVGTFARCTGLTSIPENLFANCTQVRNFAKIVIDSMGWNLGAFEGCTGLTNIPENLFANCTQVTDFSRTFTGCTGLTNISENLFTNCTQVTDFSGTFADCSGLTNIPENLFTNCTQVTNFSGTFAGCTSLTSIPETLFDSCTLVASFQSTFYECTNLTGEAIPLWERVPEGAENEYIGTPNGMGCYYGCTQLTNYSSIPEYWKSEMQYSN